MAACKQKNSKVNFQRSAAGYTHTYSDADGADLHLLSIFPSDVEINATAKDAYEEAVMLWEILGYYPTLDSNIGPTSAIFMEKAGDDDDNCSEDEEYDTDNDLDEKEPSDRRQLQNALDAAAEAQAKSLPTNKVDNALDECGYAVASLHLADLESL